MEDAATKEKKSAMHISIKSFVNVAVILLALMIAVGVLTFVVQPGSYQRDDSGSIIQDTFKPVDKAETRLPVIRWFTAPFEVPFLSSDGMTVLLIAVVLLILGGAFGVLEKTGGINALMAILIKKFSKAKYKLIWAVTLFFMLFASLFGIFEEALILLPMVIILANAMGWDNKTAMGMCVLALGVGFAVDITNPFTIGIAATLTGTSVLTGMWYRLILFVLLWVGLRFLLHILLKKRKRRKERSRTRKSLQNCR